MGSDALDRTASARTFSKKDKQEWAAKKSEEETSKILNNPLEVNKGSKAFRDHVEKERRRLGLGVKTETTIYCKKCFRQNCVC